MTAVEADRNRFALFAEEVGPRLTQALVASLGGELGREMAADALAYGWEHWSRVGAMENPAGYLYRVGRNRGRRMRRPYLLPDPPPPKSEPLVEPGLPSALARLSNRQRVSVMLVHGAGWTLSETAAVMGISPGSVYRHVERALRLLRKSLGVNSDA
ncbi:MAG: sigma-70 family RNA polymerase sigma factor [Acidimicrobiia bacterium]|nr:sigma-70 family RNA polymerase sigma factor [Acidimicrobiia bacterium]